MILTWIRFPVRQSFWIHLRPAILLQFRFSRPETFYNLDKIEVGDLIYLLWDQNRHDYEVIEVKRVSAKDLSIEDQGNDFRLTLYTCNLLKFPDERLVVIANKI
ncbi:MAG: sortase [Candidatus Moranbacteria bacterium]|nr:sortase [Candidatus Moranbacteria bacterium]